jgi:hypothetical protein
MTSAEIKIRLERAISRVLIMASDSVFTPDYDGSGGYE